MENDIKCGDGEARKELGYQQNNTSYEAVCGACAAVFRWKGDEIVRVGICAREQKIKRRNVAIQKGLAERLLKRKKN